METFPGGPVVKILPSNAGGTGSVPGQKDSTCYAAQPKKKEEKRKEGKVGRVCPHPCDMWAMLPLKIQL